MQENSPLLQLQNVGYLAGDAKILNNINFSLRAGEFKLKRWYLVAPNQNRRVALPLCDSRD